MIEQFFNAVDGAISFTREQSSAFAKEVANDFNPLHDIDAKRFTVPGDLLFGVLLHRGGLAEHMQFKFTNMVADKKALHFPLDGNGAVTDADGKVYLEVSSDGAVTAFNPGVEALIKGYVAYSGQAFPHILVPLMESAGVMINPARPMVMYESMELRLESLQLQQPELRSNVENTTISVSGKRGEVVLAFDIFDADSCVGHGVKRMLLSGLRDYDASEMAGVVALYNASRDNYLAA